VSDLPAFPVDDATLGAVEHALGYCLTFEGEGGERLDEPRGVGAEYPLWRLLDFLSGTLEDDEHVTLVDGDPALFELGVGPVPTYLDERPHYTERDVIAALIAEVRRLRVE
jgi:hypothetical protein